MKLLSTVAIVGSMKPFDSLGDRSGTGTDPAETTTLGGLIVVDDGTGNSGIGLGVCGFVGRIGGLGECTPDTIAAAGIMPGTVLKNPCIFDSHTFVRFARFERSLSVITSGRLVCRTRGSKRLVRINF